MNFNEIYVFEECLNSIFYCTFSRDKDMTCDAFSYVVSKNIRQLQTRVRALPEAKPPIMTSCVSVDTH